MQRSHRLLRYLSHTGGILASVVMVACARPSNTTVHLRNDSTAEVTNVVLSGHGFRVTTPTLGAGESTDVSVAFEGESDLAVAFMVKGRTVVAPGQGYFEGNGAYTGDVVIKPDLSVAVTFRLLDY